MENKDKQLELDKRYMRMAAIWAENSYCERRQVGAILVKDRMIISDGFNGTPSGFENVCEDDDFKTTCTELLNQATDYMLNNSDPVLSFYNILKGEFGELLR